jgi:hypothetical protein
MQLFISTGINHRNRMKDTLLPPQSVYTSDEFRRNISRPAYVLNYTSSRSSNAEITSNPTQRYVVYMLRF